MQTSKTVWGTCGACIIAATLLAALAPSAPGGSGDYLIVAAEGFVGSAPLIQLADAKTAQGFSVTTHSVPTGTSKEAIKTYIEGWYSPAADCYVLLVGDSDSSTAPSTATTIPHWLGQAFHGATTDLPYACMDGADDWYPDLFIGRFAVDNVSELQAVVDKTLCVEAGVFSDPDYARRAAFLATSSPSAEAEATHDWVIANYLDPAGYVSTRIYAAQGGNTADVTNAVNAGTLFAVYFGHSSFSAWWEPAFYAEDVQALSNAGLYGLVFSVSCGTARFDWSYGECLGEVWIREADKGAAAYLSTSDMIYSSPASAWESVRRLEKYLFESFFVDNIWEVGPAWQAALYRLLADPDYGPEHDHTRDYFEMFVLLGDPALRLPGGYEKGDLNCDGSVDFGDINPFVLALTDPAGYETQYPDCDILNGDISGNGTVGFDDINPFVALLSP